MGQVHYYTTAPSGANIGLTVQRVSDGFYRASAAETFSSAPPFLSKLITLTGDVNENAGTFNKVFTADTWQNGLYVARIHDLTLPHSGTVSVSVFGVKGGQEVAVGEESNLFSVYYADIQFTRDQANTQDEYTVSWFKDGAPIMSGVSQTYLNVVKRADGTNLIASIEMGQVGSTSVFKYDATGSARATLGEAVIVVVSGTIDSDVRVWRRLLGRDSS